MRALLQEAGFAEVRMEGPTAGAIASAEFWESTLDLSRATPRRSALAPRRPWPIEAGEGPLHTPYEAPDTLDIPARAFVVSASA